jgi:hypothetical protein
MKNFLRRLKYYGLGFGIGLIFVFFFFRNRGCSWLPENRVKNTILGKVLVIQDSQLAKLQQNGLTEKDAVDFLNDGDVNFGSSKKQGNPQVYEVEKEIDGKTVKLWFTIPKDGYISEVLWPTGSIHRSGNSKKGIGTMVAFPKVENIIYLDQNPEFKKALKEVGLANEKEVLSRLKRSGKIDFSLSHLDANPLPEHFVIFKNAKGKELRAVTTWYKEHIQFYSFANTESVGAEKK